MKGEEEEEGREGETVMEKGNWRKVGAKRNRRWRIYMDGEVANRIIMKTNERESK